MPLYTHDCTECEYLGSTTCMGQEVDIYLSCDKSSYPFIVRYNSEGAEYATVDVGSAMYRTCCEVRDDPARRVNLLSERRREQMGERETLLAKLHAVMQSIQDIDDEIDHWEQNGIDQELLAMESQAENGVAY